MDKVVILGAGMAGFGAAHRLDTCGLRSALFEKSSFYGGHTASFSFDNGFIFDDGPHISFTKHERIQRILAESVKGEYEIVQARVNNYWNGYWIKHPVQCNLYVLPKQLTQSIIKDFVSAQQNEQDFSNFENWLISSYGRTFAETFPMVYGQKYHTTPSHNMTTDWLGTRFYRPKLDELLKGASEPTTPDVHYVTHFRYPRRGGFVSYLKPLPELTDLKLGHELLGLDPDKRELHFRDEVKETYDFLISSIPLPDLIPRIVGAPQAVVEASRRLAWSACVNVNIGVDREDLSDAQWSYFYDPDIFFVRLSFPHMLSPNVVPKGSGSIQVEIYYSNKYKPLDRQPEQCMDPVIRDLYRCGLLREQDRILHRNARLVPFANVIFDHERASALSCVHNYLDEVGIFYCGRYGEWGHHWTDESFLSGEDAAQRVLDKITSK